jgi:hypothetical protein
VAVQHGRQYIGIELNPEYVELGNRRFAETIKTGVNLDDGLLFEARGGVTAGDQVPV